MGPPTAQESIEKMEKLGVSMKTLMKEYGSFDVEPISVDEQVSDGDMIGSLKVIHTPGHTPGHISLYYEKRDFFLEQIVYTNTFLGQRVCTYLHLKYQ